MNHNIEVEFSVLRCVGTAKGVFLFEITENLVIKAPKIWLFAVKSSFSYTKVGP